jgi:hypothetical protein
LNGVASLPSSGHRPSASAHPPAAVPVACFKKFLTWSIFAFHFPDLVDFHFSLSFLTWSMFTSFFSDF